MHRVGVFGSVVGIVAAMAGCSSIQYTTDYQSSVRHEPLPLRSTVTVLVSPELREEMQDDAARLEGMRQMYQEALRQDLDRNGPITPVAVSPEARLQVTLKIIKAKDLPLAIMTWMFSPTWLLGVPYNWGHVDMAADIKLTSAWGDPLYQTAFEFGCTRVEGLYYGHDDLTFGCPGKKIAEAIRERLSLNRSDILARVTKSKARFAALNPAPSSPREERRGLRPDPRRRSTATDRSRGPGRSLDADLKETTDFGSRAVRRRQPAPVAAVFNIRDMSGRFDALILEQLTEYLSVQIASELEFKVVPREEIRGRLAESKAESMRACYDESCQIEVGKALAANKSVSTTLIRIGRRCAFTSTVYDLRTEAADYAASVQTSCNEDALLDGVDRIVKGLGRRQVDDIK